MQQRASLDGRTPRPEVMLVELVIVLVVNGIDPAIIDPGVLREGKP